MPDILVIGGGIVGMSAAYYCVSAGARTVLVDRADPGQATAAGAGIIAPETSSHASDAWLELAFAAVDAYPALVAQLEADGAGDTGYAPLAELIVAVSPDEDAPFAAARAAILARQQKYGRPAPTDLATVDDAAARALFPLLAPVRSALLFRRAARVDGRRLLNALKRAAVARGLVVVHGDARALVLKNGIGSGVIVAGETIPAGAIILAGGAWSASFAAQLDISIPIQPQRGQIIQLALPETDTSEFPIVTGFRGHYLVPWSDRRIVVGATRESGSGFAPHTTAAGIREVLNEALRAAPGLANATVADIRVGLRPATPDQLPILGSIPTARNIYLAAGHGATGLQLGPYSGKLMADLALGNAPAVNLAPFSITRFT